MLNILSLARKSNVNKTIIGMAKIAKKSYFAVFIYTRTARIKYCQARYGFAR